MPFHSSTAWADDGDNGDGDHNDGGSGSGDNDNDDSGDNDQSGSSDDSDNDDESADNDGLTRDAGSGNQGGDRYITGEIVVANVDADGLAQIEQLGFRILEETRLEALDLTVLRLSIPPGLEPRQARTQIAAALPTIIVDVNSLYATQGQITLPSPDYPQAMIGWTRGAASCGRGMKIGIIDTAVDASLPAFAGAEIRQQSFASNAVSNVHGTAVAAILVGQPERSEVTGLLPGAELDVAGVFASDSTGAVSADAVALAGGLNWLAERHVSVVNMSLAGEANSLVETAIRRLAKRGMVFVASVGNGGPDASPAFPATMPEVIGVTAIDSDGHLYKESPKGVEVDFAAPGVRIWAPNRGNAAGRYFSGTSFATPFVTAAVALAMQDGVKGTDALQQRLAEHVQDLGDAGRDSAFGWGLIRAATPCASKDGPS